MNDPVGDKMACHLPNRVFVCTGELSTFSVDGFARNRGKRRDSQAFACLMKI